MGDQGNVSVATRRVIEFVSPLDDDLLFRRMSGEESLGRLFEYQVELLSPRGDIDGSELLGQSATVKLELPDGGERHFNAHVAAFSQGADVGRFKSYRAILRPWLWFMTRRADCCIFQDKTVPEILKEMFDKYEQIANVDFGGLSAEYRKWEYCVQYRESDFNFVSRLMEHEGIYYYFEHSDGAHKMVLADGPAAHTPAPGSGELPFFAEELRARPGAEYVHHWQSSREIRSGVFAATDYDFKRPNVPLATTKANVVKPALPNAEIFDYPGSYVAIGDGEQYAGVRLEELQTGFEVANGLANARSLAAGHTFELVGHPRRDQNIVHLVTRALHQLELSGYEAGEEESSSCICDFSVIPAKAPFRPARITPKPVVRGPQTAVVVGPEGDEIYVDNYGRVKVQFFWDRYGKNDENSSCWIRVSQPWAGKNWGMIAIPRIHQEVIVDFLEGDPDQPIITGRVYNGDQMPPYDLPANMTQTGIKSRSSKGGTPANFNEIRFEDKKGSEQLYIHAERNQDIEVEADETHSVGHDRRKTIHNDETTEVKNNRTEKVGVNEDITIGNNRTEKVGVDEEITIGANRRETVHADESVMIDANRSHVVGADEALVVGANQTIAVGAARDDTVSGTVNQTIGGDLIQTVAGNVNLTTPGSVTVTAAGGYTVIAPGGTKFVDNQFFKVGASDFTYYSFKGSFVANKVDVSQLAMAAVANKFDASLNKIEARNNYFQTAGNEIRSVGQGIKQVGATLILATMFGIL